MKRRANSRPAGRPAKKAGRSTITYLTHITRIAVFVSIVGLIHWQHVRHAKAQRRESASQSLVPHLVKSLPSATHVLQGEDDAKGQLQSVVGRDDNVIGYIARTSPLSDHIVGFSGPTDSLLVFDLEKKLIQTVVLGSEDTRDHVNKILSDDDFLGALNGNNPSELQRMADVDVVSGATLTCFAILEGIRYRLQNSVPDRSKLLKPPHSLRFPDPPQIEEVRVLFPNADAISVSTEPNAHWAVLKKDEETDERQQIGSLIRTSPASDNIIGYQGPTDTLIGVDSSGVVLGIAVGKSYDNEPYVGYVREDSYFRKRFNSLSIHELSEIDMGKERIEGVSGATMTSIAVAEGIIQGAQTHVASLQMLSSDDHTDVTHAPTSLGMFTVRNVSTLLIAAAGLVLGLTRLKGKKRFRVAYQILLIVWLGLINGDMLSQALLLGWSQHGIPFEKAMGLTFLTAAAFVVPIASGRNVYCSHICPHGALQQLVRNRLPWRMRLSSRSQRLLKLLPVALLLWVLAIGLLQLSASAVDIEPFDAWIWSVAGTATILVAVLGLGFSLVVPMGYCRYGCPTGVVLDYLRISGKSSWTTRDTAGLLMLGAAIAFIMLSQ